MGSKLVSDGPRQSLRRQFGFFSDFDALGPRQQHTYVVADLDANADLAATPIFAPTVPVIVHDVSILPDGTVGGIDGSNTSVWAVTNGAAAMVSKTYDATNTHPIDNVSDSLGTIAVPYVAAGGRLELAVTNGTTANTVRTLVTVSYSDASHYLDGWQVYAPDGGSATLSDGRPTSLIVTPSDATAADNDEIYVYRQIEEFDFTAGKPLVIEQRYQYSEVATDDANAIFGLANAWGANTLLDNGAGPKADYSGACFYKVDGETAWRVESSVGTSQSTNVTNYTAASSGYVELRIEARNFDDTNVEVTYWVGENGNDHKQCRDATTGLPIKHYVPMASVTDMAVGFGVKNGDTAAETLNVDYVAGEQLR